MIDRWTILQVVEQDLVGQRRQTDLAGMAQRSLGDEIIVDRVGAAQEKCRYLALFPAELFQDLLLSFSISSWKVSRAL